MTLLEQRIVRGPILNPSPDGRVTFYADGALLAGQDGRINFAGDWKALQPQLGSSEHVITQADGIITPPFLDCHTHIPQFPIRGHFTDGLPDHLKDGRLLAGLERNVFPQEGRCESEEYATEVVRDFAGSTLSQGVIGGAAYMTVHRGATQAALRDLSPEWSVGMVLMNQHCPPYLRTQIPILENDICTLAEEFGKRLIVTDRFAVSVDSSLRRRGVALAAKLGLRMQTHLNEQRAEKALVEKVLYPNYQSYTDVYRRDGLLDCSPLMAHCIQMRPEEWQMLARDGVAVAHCPTSNTLLGSGTLPLDKMSGYGIPYAICTDVGASPTTSMLAEMAQFLKVHQGRSTLATPSAALFHATLAPAQILGLDQEIGSFEVGKKLSWIEIASSGANLIRKTADEVIRTELLDMPSISGLEKDLDDLASIGLDHGKALCRLKENVHRTAELLASKVLRVSLSGETVWEQK